MKRSYEMMQLLKKHEDWRKAKFIVQQVSSKILEPIKLILQYKSLAKLPSKILTQRKILFLTQQN